MTNKKKSKIVVLHSLVGIVVAGSLVFTIFSDRFGRVLGRNSDDVSNRDDGHRRDREDDRSGDNGDKRSIGLPTLKLSPTEYISPSPTEVVVPSGVLPVVPSSNLEKEEEKTEIEGSKEVGVYTETAETEKNETEVVSVSERSVVSGNSNYSVPVAAPTKSIFKKIENKIKNVGGSGQFLSRPKTMATPTPIKKDDDFTPPVALGPDSSIFYMVTDTDLLLGAVDKENKRINVDEVELRGAEITMNKVLAKKGLELGVSSAGSLVLTENGVRSYFDLPVFVDVFSHEISVDTTSGKKQIKTTPVKAVVNAIDSGYLENVDKKVQMVMGTTSGGELAYRLEGDKEFKVLGRFNVKGAQYVYVDVETGEVSEGNQPLLSKFLKLISL